MIERPRVAFVVQRCGDEVLGGAERLAYASARAMASEWNVEILTTCAIDARTWSNAYAPGPTSIGGVPARRFAVAEPRDPRAFDRLSARLARDAGSLADQERWMRAQGPDATTLFAFLREHGSDYACAFFFSYLYATTYFGVSGLRDRAVLVPLAHDEWTLQLPLFERLFESGTHVGFVSEEERLLIEMRFPGAAFAATMLRTEIVAPRDLDAQAFRSRYGIEGPFALYVGRVDAAKGVDALLADFASARREDPERRKLVLVGPISLAFGRLDGVVALGPLSEADKWNAYAAADFAIVPSAVESLSLTALEAWAAGKAVLANGASAVLVGQCRRSNAGLWYAGRGEFAELMRTALLGRAAALGANGARYVARTFTAETARASFREAFATRMGRAS